MGLGGAFVLPDLCLSTVRGELLSVGLPFQSFELKAKPNSCRLRLLKSNYSDVPGMDMKNQRAVLLQYRSVSCVLIAVFGCAIAFAASTPTTLRGATIVDAAKAKSLMQAGAIMIDARVANEYAESHIKGAQNVPYKEKSEKTVAYDSTVDRFDLSRLPGDKNRSIIFGCNGPECWKSYKASRAAIKAGFKNVYWLRGGLPEWETAGYPVE